MRYWLVQLRGERSQEEMSEEIDICRGYYAQLEYGLRNPSVKLAKHMGEVMGFDWTQFFEEEIC